MPEEFQAAVARIKQLLESPEIQVTREPELDRLLVERYIPGAEVAVEGLLTRGKLRILGVFDKPDPLEGPYFEETIYVTPSRLPDEMYDRVLDCAERTVRALGLTHGPVHAEFRVNDEGPVGAGSGAEAHRRAVLARASIRAASAFCWKNFWCGTRWACRERTSTAKTTRPA